VGACTFCRILTGELVSSRVLEDNFALAFLDIRPINPGHTLVIPRRHVVSFVDLTAEEAQRVILMGQRVASAQKATLGCGGITFSVADGEAAGQEVPHTHLHVIPRHSGDGFGWRLPARYGPNSDRGSLEEIASRIGNGLRPG
jgi:histidine triad (HIT) family protein